MFKLRNCKKQNKTKNIINNIIPLNQLISNLLPVQVSRNLAWGQQRAEKVIYFDKI